MSDSNPQAIIKVQMLVAVIAVVGGAIMVGPSFAFKIWVASLLISVNLALWSYLILQMAKTEQIPKLKLSIVFLLKMFLLFGGFWVLYAPLGFPALALMLGVATLPMAAIIQALKF